MGATAVTDHLFSLFGEATSAPCQSFVATPSGTATPTVLIQGEMAYHMSQPNLVVLRIDEGLEPIKLLEVKYSGRLFRFSEPLTLYPNLDQTGTLLVAKHRPLGIHVFADTREELLDELHEQIAMLWDDYACENDDNLSPAAIALKKRLLRALSEI